jgi:hypothetical protein
MDQGVDNQRASSDEKQYSHRHGPVARDDANQRALNTLRSLRSSRRETNEEKGRQ